MPRNAVQFQKSLSELAFYERYSGEKQCLEELEALRWPNGFVCPECGHNKAHRLPSRPRLQQCAKCRYQASVAAGTIMHQTRSSLTIWFRAIYHLAQSKNGVSALELKRRLGVNCDTAWKLKHKLMQVMKEREVSVQLSQWVEIDDAYLGRERPREPGKSGGGSLGKTPFIAAVETDEDGRPLRMALQVVKVLVALKLDNSRCTNSNQRVTCTPTGGLACFAAVIDASCSHTYCVSGGGRKAAQNPTLKWVNTYFGNIKFALTGTYRHINARHVPRYLAEFQYRFNRCFDLAGMLQRLAYVSLRTPPMPYDLLKLAESHG